MNRTSYLSKEHLIEQVDSMSNLIIKQSAFIDKLQKKIDILEKIISSTVSKQEEIIKLIKEVNNG